MLLLWTLSVMITDIIQFRAFRLLFATDTKDMVDIQRGLFQTLDLETQHLS